MNIPHKTILLTDDEIQSILHYLSMFREDEDAVFIAKKIAKQQIQDPNHL